MKSKDLTDGFRNSQLVDTGIITRYAVLYLNGSYWGVYNIREAHSPTHYAEHYGYDVETVSQWKGSWPQESEFEEVYRYALNHDLSVEEHYAYVAQHVNIESVIGWCIMQVYSGNIDFNSPNMRFYYSTEDQMLRSGRSGPRHVRLRKLRGDLRLRLQLQHAGLAPYAEPGLPLRADDPARRGDPGTARRR